MEYLETLGDVYMPLLYGVAALVGLVSCFYGYRLFKMFLVLVFAIAFAGLLAGIGYEMGGEQLIWTVSGFFVGAILGALLAMFFYAVAVAIAGALLVASLVGPWVQDMDWIYQALIVGGGCFIGALLAIKITTLTLQAISAFIGAFLLVYSVRFFVLAEPFLQRSAESNEMVVGFSSTWSIGAFVLGALGMFVQWRAEH